jgi:hypothetical protein
MKSLFYSKPTAQKALNRNANISFKKTHNNQRKCGNKTFDEDVPKLLPRLCCHCMHIAQQHRNLVAKQIGQVGNYTLI